MYEATQLPRPRAACSHGRRNGLRKQLERGRLLVWASRALLTLLSLSILVAGGPARAQALLRCEVTKTLHTACCCPSTSSDEARPSMVPLASTVRAASSSCCTWVELDRAPPSSLQSLQTQVLPPVLLALVAPACRGFGALPRILLPADTAPRRLAPPRPLGSALSLIVLHRRFLI